MCIFLKLNKVIINYQLSIIVIIIVIIIIIIIIIIQLSGQQA